MASQGTFQPVFFRIRWHVGTLSSLVSDRILGCRSVVVGGGFEPALQEMRKQTRRDLSLSSKVCVFLAFFLSFFLYPSVLPLPRPIRK